jgi:hypothetical protein
LTLLMSTEKKGKRMVKSCCMQYLTIYIDIDPKQSIQIKKVGHLSISN